MGSAIFEVTGLRHGSLIYDPLENHDPDGDSDGTIVVVLQPELQ